MHLAQSAGLGPYVRLKLEVRGTKPCDRMILDRLRDLVVNITTSINDGTNSRPLHEMVFGPLFVLRTVVCQHRSAQKRAKDALSQYSEVLSDFESWKVGKWLF